MIHLLICLVGFAMAGIQPLDSAPKKKHTKGALVEFLAHPKIHKNKNAFVARLTVPANGKVPLHRDTTEEYLYVLEGGGLITIDGQQSSISAGDTVFMPAGAAVKFANGSEKLVAIQVFAGPGPEKKYDSKVWKPLPGVKSKEKAAK